MFCPKCELEIKGEDQIKCPICDSELVENPIQAPQNAGDEDDFRIEDLVDKTDDDSKTEKNISDNNTIEDNADNGEEFKLELDEDNKSSDLDNSEKDIFKLEDKEEGKSISEEQVSEFKFEDSEQPEGTSDLEKDIFKLEDEPDDTISQEKTPGSEPTETDEPVEIDEDKVFELDLSQDDEVGGESQDEISDFKLDEEHEIKQDEPFDKTDEEKPVNEPEIEIDSGKPDEESVEEVQEIPEEEIEDISEMEETTSLSDIDPLADMNIEEPSKPASNRRMLFIVLIFIFGTAIGFGALYLFTDKEPPPTVAEKPVAVKPEKEVKKEPVKPPEQKPAVAVTKPEEIKTEEDIPPKKEPEKAVSEEPIPEEKRVEVEISTEGVMTTEKPAPTVETKPEPVPKTTYSVHAGSYRNSERANAEVRRFSNHGFNAYIERADLGEKGIWYRVKIGMFNTKEAASKEQEVLNRKIKGVESRVVTN